MWIKLYNPYNWHIGLGEKKKENSFLLFTILKSCDVSSSFRWPHQSLEKDVFIKTMISFKHFTNLRILHKFNNTFLNIYIFTFKLWYQVIIIWKIRIKTLFIVQFERAARICIYYYRKVCRTVAYDLESVCVSSFLLRVGFVCRCMCDISEITRDPVRGQEYNQ